ncbi:MAG: methylmalonyl Co-A mutase-associated GTPase MeaB [Acidimicrobiia bacterium]
MTAPAGLVAAVRAGDRSSLARLLTLVESGGEDARAALSALGALPVRIADAVATVGITGAPGAGKSTLTDRLVGRLRADGDEVAVLAVDPTSPFTGGAILGDRVRMLRHETDPAVFIRSMATRGHLGGLARATPQAIRVLAAAGFRWILVETVGVGQVEVEIAGAADTTVVVVNPGWGDGVQASKAGLLEVGDVFVVNKADRDGVAATVRDLQGMLALGGARAWTPPVVETVATADRGIDELHDAIAAHRGYLTASGELRVRRERRIADELRALVLDRFLARADDMCSGDRFAAAVRDVAAGLSDPYTAATDLSDGADPDADRRAERRGER